MSAIRPACDRLADILAYPRASIAADAAAAASAVREWSEEAASHLEDLQARAARMSQSDWEELYTRTFDLHAPCCLEVGWQIFGDTYKRGSFLVRLRLAAREHGVSEDGELPDHLATVLRLLARLPEAEDPRGLVEEAVLPAVEKMRASLGEDGSNPYRAVLDAVAASLAAQFDVDRARLRRPVRHLPLAEAQP
jgi:nitrate reductase delta subunit